METYRIVCRFEPGHKRLAGQIAGTKTRKTQRGAWRVLDAYQYPAEHFTIGWNADAVQVSRGWIPDPEATPSARSLGILTARPQRVGTLCDPFKLLKEWQAARRAAQ